MHCIWIFFIIDWQIAFRTEIWPSSWDISERQLWTSNFSIEVRMTKGVNDISLGKGGRFVGLPTLAPQPPGIIQASTRLKKMEIKKIPSHRQNPNLMLKNNTLYIYIYRVKDIYIYISG